MSDQDSIARGALTAGRSALVWRRQIADTDTPISAALKLFEPGRGDFLLESVEGGAVRGRYSLIGLAPDLMFRAHGDKAEINRHWATNRDAFEPCETGALASLRALVEECRAESDEGLPKALACLVGYFGYETVGLVERLPRPPQNELNVPDMLFARPTVILVFDRLADALYLVAPVWKDDVSDIDRAISEALDRIDAAAARLAAPLPPSADSDEIADIEVTPVLPEGHYAQMVSRAKDRSEEHTSELQSH